jgi:hypothetical protein
MKQGCPGCQTHIVVFVLFTPKPFGQIDEEARAQAKLTYSAMSRISSRSHIGIGETANYDQNSEVTACMIVAVQSTPAECL